MNADNLLIAGDALLKQLQLTSHCRCEYRRNTRGVPVWSAREGGGIERILIRRCSACLAIEAWEATTKPMRRIVIDEAHDEVEPGDPVPNNGITDFT